MMVEGIMIPGKEEASSSRLDTLRGVLTTQPTQELINSAAEYVVLPIGYFVITEAKGTDAINLIKAYKRAKDLKETKAIDLTNKEIAEVIEKLKAALPKTESIKSMSVKDYFAKLTAAQSAVDGLSEESMAKIALVIGASFGPLELQKQINTIKEKDENKANEILNMNANEFAQKMLQQESGFEGSETIDKLIQSNNAKAAYYEANRVEIDVQIDLLLKNIMLIARSI